MKVFVIADTHFGHENIIRYCSRPFKSVCDMDEAMVKNWNETVSNSDTIIHLGDLGLGSKDYIRGIVSRLNGKKILVYGNHDNWSESFYRDIGFAYVSRFPILYADFYLMSHAPLILSDTTPYFNCYGHVHNDARYTDTATTKCFSVERIGYRPALLFEKH